MGSVCTTRSSAVDVAEPEHRDVKPLVPYIVVSSVSLSHRIAEENMHLSVEKTARRGSCSSSSRQFLRTASARKRRKSSGNISVTKETLLFEDDDHNKKMEIEIENKQEVPYLSLGAETHEQSKQLAENGESHRIASMASLAETKDDVSLTSDLLTPESRNRIASVTAVAGSQADGDAFSQHSITVAPPDIPDDTEIPDVSQRRRSDSNTINRYKTKEPEQNLNESFSNTDVNWETVSMKQKLQKAKSISAIDLLHQMRGKSEGVATSEGLTNDEDIWKWLESRAAADSGRSSPTETMQDEATLKELIAGRAEADIIANIDAIRNYHDIKHYITPVR